ncbi:unnamed protein product [Phaeothamnion confervicola]
MLDYGYPQGTSTESLKSYVYNEPVVVEAATKALRMPASLKTKTTPSTAVHKPVTTAQGQRGGRQKNEIFVDILERLNVLFSAGGQVLNSTIDGCIQMKSYLSGNPELRLALNEDLVIGKGGGSYGSVVLDDCNFHECVRLDDFETLRQASFWKAGKLSFIPPDGEFVVLNYRITGEFRAPFRLFPSMEEVSPYRLDVVVVVRMDVPEANHGSNVIVRVPMPRNTTSVSLDGGGAGQSGEYMAAERKVVWTIKKFQGGSEVTLVAKATLGTPCIAATRREVGPISMQFEIPMYNVSNLQVRYLKIAENAKSYHPYRWVRYVTQSSSYVCRV